MSNVVTPYVYWRWLLTTSAALDEQRNAGTLSRMHLLNPDDPSVTWCGALAIEGAEYGIAGVYYTYNAQDDIGMCEDCARMHKPMKVDRGRTGEVAA